MIIKLKFKYSPKSVRYLKRGMKFASNYISRGIAKEMYDVVSNAYSLYNFLPRKPDTESKYLLQGYDYDPDAMKKTGDSLRAIRDIMIGKNTDMADIKFGSTMSDELVGKLDSEFIFIGEHLNYWNTEGFGRPIEKTTYENVLSKRRKIVIDALEKAFSVKTIPRGYDKYVL